MIVAVSAALLAFIASAVISNDHNGLIGVFIVIINLYGLVMSLKHYERSRMHINVRGKYRDMISNVSEIDGRKNNMARKEGKDAHPTRFPRLNRIRGDVLWSRLHLILAFVGLTVCFY